MKIKLAPSLLAADFSDLKNQVIAAQQAGADYLHIDVMDGLFVPNITLGPCIVSAIRPHTSLVFDVHLMIQEPVRYLRQFAESGADIITVHYEACTDVADTLRQIRQLGVKAGLAVKPATSISAVADLLPLCDLALVMSVEPGFGGQTYIHGSETKAAELRDLIKAQGLSCEIEMDGGLSPATVPMITASGVQVVVAGSAFFGAPDLIAAADAFRTAAEE